MRPAAQPAGLRTTQQTLTCLASHSGFIAAILCNTVNDSYALCIWKPEVGKDFDSRLHCCKIDVETDKMLMLRMNICSNVCVIFGASRLNVCRWEFQWSSAHSSSSSTFHLVAHQQESVVACPTAIAVDAAGKSVCCDIGHIATVRSESLRRIAAFQRDGHKSNLVDAQFLDCGKCVVMIAYESSQIYVRRFCVLFPCQS